MSDSTFFELSKIRFLIKRGKFSSAKKILKELFEREGKKKLAVIITEFLNLYFASRDDDIRLYLEKLNSKAGDDDLLKVYKGALVSIYYDRKDHIDALKILGELEKYGEKSAKIDRFLIYVTGLRDRGNALKILKSIRSEHGELKYKELSMLLLPDVSNVEGKISTAAKEIILRDDDKINSSENLIPERFEISNYPNPFNPSTTIEFDLPERSNVRIVIYDVLGREVKVLIDDDLDAGRYKINFSGSGLSSGVYFCRMEAGKFARVRKMILIK